MRAISLVRVVEYLHDYTMRLECSDGLQNNISMNWLNKYNPIEWVNL